MIRRVRNFAIHVLVYLGLITVFLRPLHAQSCEVEATAPVSVASEQAIVTARTPDKLRFTKTPTPSEPSKGSAGTI